MTSLQDGFNESNIKSSMNNDKLNEIRKRREIELQPNNRMVNAVSRNIEKFGDINKGFIEKDIPIISLSAEEESIEQKIDRKIEEKITEKLINKKKSRFSGLKEKVIIFILYVLISYPEFSNILKNKIKFLNSESNLPLLFVKGLIFVITFFTLKKKMKI